MVPDAATSKAKMATKLPQWAALVVLQAINQHGGPSEESGGLKFGFIDVVKLVFVSKTNSDPGGAAGAAGVTSYLANILR